MDNRPVAIIDSGIGGLPYLSWIQENLPHETLVYLADRKNFPYGEKQPDQVKKAVEEAVRALVDRFNPKILVVACNTASVIALNHLRSLFSFPIVGVVPAVKLAAQISKNKKIGVLATANTIAGPYLKELIQEFAADTTMVCLAATDIVTHVEDDYLNPDLENRRKILGAWANELKAQDVDTVVLGCTHFLHVSEDIRMAMGKQIHIVDSREGVGRQVSRLLEKHQILADKKDADTFYFSCPLGGFQDQSAMEAKYKIFSDRYRLGYGGPLFL